MSVGNLIATAQNNNGDVAADNDFMVGLFEKVKRFSEWGNSKPKEYTNCSSAWLEQSEETYSAIFNFQNEFEKRKMFKDGQALWSQWLQVAVEGITCTSSVGNSEDQNRLKLNKVIALAYNNRGYLKYLQVDFEGAIQDYTNSLKYDPSLACSYYNRGLVTYRLAFFKQSYEDMVTAVQLDPNNVVFREALERVKDMVGSTKGHEFMLQ